jgi:hypothetical protein
MPEAVPLLAEPGHSTRYPSNQRERIAAFGVRIGVRTERRSFRYVRRVAPSASVATK